jgi:TPR repeat protein
MSSADAEKLAQIQARVTQERLARAAQTAGDSTGAARATGGLGACWVPWALTLLITAAGAGTFAALSLFGDSTGAGDTEGLERLAAAGEPGAQLGVALIHDYGFGGGAHDSALARDWYERAAEGGSVSAQYYLGRWHLERSGERDVDAGLHWLRRAADQRHAEAELLLADLYRTGIHVPKDLPLAITWYERAADEGNAEAMCRAARIYAGIDPGSRLDPPAAAKLDHMARALGRDCGLTDYGYGASEALAKWAKQEGVRAGEERLAKGFARRPTP